MAPKESNKEEERAMKSSRVLMVAILLATGLNFSEARQPASKIVTGGVVYTADEIGNSISAINLASRKVEIVPVQISPHNVQVTADGSRLLAVGGPAAHNHSQGAAGHVDRKVQGRLLVFDTEKLAAGPLASIPVGLHPGHVVVDRSGQRAYVTISEENLVAVVDFARNTVARRVATGRYPHGLRLSPDGRDLYVANVEDGSVSVIDAASSSEVARIPVGRAPVQVGFTPDGAHLYVSLRDENSVAVIDTAKRMTIGKIAVGRGPIQVHATPDGRFVYVANQGTETEPADTVSVIEVATGKVVDTIQTGKGAHGVAVSDDGRLVFVTNIVAGTVSVIDALSRAVIADFRVGKGPNGVTFRPRGV
jgi:YVTN family beta-propeller protein